MSRSFKKHDGWNEAGCRGWHKHYARCVERRKRNRWLDDFPKGKGYVKVFPQYDVRDYSWCDGPNKGFYQHREGREFPPHAQKWDWRAEGVRK